jgi:hypothetical protein
MYPSRRMVSHFNPYLVRVHSTLHTAEYYREVASRLLVAQNADQARAILSGIAAELMQGGLIMNGRVAR